MMDNNSNVGINRMGKMPALSSQVPNIQPSMTPVEAPVVSSTTSIQDSKQCIQESVSSVAASHKCVFCSQIFDTKVALQDHFRRHANGEIDIKGVLKVKQSQPEREDFKAEGKIKLTEGNQPGTRFESAVCDICNEVFRSTSAAITHKFRKHPESVEKHYCPHCGMMFPIKANRDKHITSHGTNSKPNQVFPCLPCKVAFYNERARSFHIESAHKGAIRLVNPIQTPAPSLKIVVNNAGEAHSIYYCHLCGCEYQVKYNLQKHLISRHTEVERNATPQAMVQCSMCSALFYSERAYIAHNLHHRQSDLYATSETMRQQVVQRIDQDFDLRRVPTTIEKIVSTTAIRQNRSATWKSIRAANKKEKEEMSPSEWFGNSLNTEDQINKNVDTKDANQNIFSETSDNDGTENVDLDLKKRISESEENDHKRFRKKQLCLEKTDQLGSPMVTDISENSKTDSKNNQSDLISREQKDRIVDKGKIEHSDDRKDCNDGKEYIDSSKEPDSMEEVDLKEVAISETDKITLVDQQKTIAENDDSGSDELEVEKIVGMRKAKDGDREFLVRWQGFEPADDTWEKEHFLNCTQLIQQFLCQNKRKVGPSDINTVEWYDNQGCKKRKL